MLYFCTVSILMRSVNNCFGIIRTSAIETVQETLARLRYWRKTLAGLWVLLDFCFRDCAKNPLQVASLVENPCGFGCFTGFLLARLCKKPR